MEKLIELLNKYEKEKKSGFTWRSIDSYDNCVYGVDCDGETEITMYSDLYSKQYGFIQWLVENDKIDRDKILKENGQFRMFYYDLERVKNYDRLVMYLSVEDSPIEFLISILKIS